MKRIFLDDKRAPKLPYDYVVRDEDDFVALLKEVGLDNIGHISFDHDLGLLSGTGFDCAKWLVEFDIEGTWGRLPDSFTWNIHSANPVGAANIESYLTSYWKHRKLSIELLKAYRK